MPSRDERIAQLITDAQAAIPGLGNRAEKAADLVSTVFALGKQSGVDWWQVDTTHRVSIAGKVCDCHDAHYGAPTQDKNGKPIGPICKHRLAVMFEIKLRKQNGDALAAILTQIRDAGGAGRLYVHVDHTGTGRPDEWAVKGYFIPGQSKVMLGDFPADWLAIGADELVAALVVAGLRVTDKPRGVGREYIWMLAPAVPEDANEDIRIGVLGSMDASWVERKQREEYFSNRAKIDARMGAYNG